MCAEEAVSEILEYLSDKYSRTYTKKQIIEQLVRLNKCVY